MQLQCLLSSIMAEICSGRLLAWSALRRGMAGGCMHVSPPCTAMTPRCPRLWWGQGQDTVLRKQPVEAQRFVPALRCWQQGSSVAGGEQAALEHSGSFLMAIPSLVSCSRGCLAMTPALVLLQWFNPVTPAFNSRVQACALPLSCQGLWGNHLISVLQIPLSWRIPLCCLALPIHGVLHVGLSID